MRASPSPTQKIGAAVSPPMLKRRREHPAALPTKAPYYLLLLSVPIFQGMTEAIVVTLGLILYWGIRRRRRYYTLTHHHLLLERGIVFRQNLHIPLSHITTLTIQRPIWLRIVGAARITINTEGNARRRTDTQLTVSNRYGRLFLPDSNGILWRPHAVRIWLLALLSSDSFGGVLLLTAILRQSSILLGEGIRQTVLDNLEEAADRLSTIPRTAALLMLILLCGWLTGVLRHLLRHLPFGICRGTHTITLYAGWLNRRIHCCAVDAIHDTDISQTLTACLCRRQTVYIHCTGYGDPHTPSILLPPGTRAQTQKELTALLPHLSPVAVRLRPCRGALWRYIRLPLALLAALPLCSGGLGMLFPLWWELIRYLALMGTLPCLWLLAVRIIDRYRAGIGWNDDRYTLCYARHLTLHRVTLPRNRVATVRIRQTPWQRRHSICDLTLSSDHAKRRPHRVRHLSIQEVRTLFNGGSDTYGNHPHRPTGGKPTERRCEHRRRPHYGGAHLDRPRTCR